MWRQESSQNSSNITGGETLMLQDWSPPPRWQRWWLWWCTVQMTSSKKAPSVCGYATKAPPFFLRDSFVSQFSLLCSICFGETDFLRLWLAVGLKVTWCRGVFDFQVWEGNWSCSVHLQLCAMRYDVLRASDWPLLAVVSHVTNSQNALMSWRRQMDHISHHACWVFSQTDTWTQLHH